MPEETFLVIDLATGEVTHRSSPPVRAGEISHQRERWWTWWEFPDRR